MPAPSKGCQTCRSRHIKCDRTRPTCLNCQKSKRHCAGWREDDGIALFLSENIYASSQLRRPRGGARWNLESSDASVSRQQSGNQGQTSDLATVPKTIVSDKSVAKDIALYSYTGTNTTINSTLQQPIVDVAVCYFAHAYFRTTTPSAENLWSLVQHHFRFNSPFVGDGILNLAFSALTLVHYGRSNGVLAAMTEGRKQYSHALREIRSAIEDRSIALTDELLISVMIMASYENNVTNFDKQKLLTYSFQHHQGALVLLRIRQQHRRGRCSPGSIDQCIRRQVIKSSIYQHTPLPDWLHDGSEFGEEDIYMGLDRCSIRLASLRHDLAKLFYDGSDISQFRKSNVKPMVEALIAESVSILQNFDEWRATINPKQHYQVVFNDPTEPPPSSAFLFYSSRMYKYRDAENASLWTRYHGTRLFTACVLIKLLFIWRHVINEDSNKYVTTEQIVHADACATADDICSSIPFAFGIHFSNQEDIETIIERTTPGALCSLNWPLVILSGSFISNEPQKQWAQEVMLLISSITGNGTIRTLASMQLQNHTRLRPEALLEHKEHGDTVVQMPTDATP